MLTMHILQKKIFNAITNDNEKLVFQLLSQNIDLNICLKDEPFSILDCALTRLYEKTASIEIIYELLKYGADVNLSCNHTYPLHTALCFSSTQPQLMNILLQYGANPNTTEDLSTLITVEDEIKSAKLLLDYGAQYNLEIPNGYASTNALHNAVRSGNIKMIKLLLDYGADPLSDEEGYLIDIDEPCNQLLFDDVNLTEKECDELKLLLNPNNPPYLKLGENEEDKYIVYENAQTQQGIEPFLLTDKKPYKQKKYLYADNKSDTFVYWAYTKGLLEEYGINKVENYLESKDIKDTNVLDNLIKKTLGHELNTEHFNAKGKKFASSYLTVTHWWYNLHTDFNRLYQKENTKLPREIKSQKEFDTLMKLLDIRYEQFQSGKDFNSNQNREELEALIGGRKAPERVVDLNLLKDVSLR